MVDFYGIHVGKYIFTIHGCYTMGMGHNDVFHDAARVNEDSFRPCREL